MTRDVIDAPGEVVEHALDRPRDRTGEAALQLVAVLLRYVQHHPGCLYASSTCSCGLARAVQAAVVLGAPAPTIVAHAPPPAHTHSSSHDAEAALLGGALGGLLGTLLRKSQREKPPAPPVRTARDRRADESPDTAGERARTVVRRRRSR